MTTTISTSPAPTTHKVTGLPVTPVPSYKVGDLVTEHIGSDGYPGVVVKVSPSTVYVRRVGYLLGNVTEHSHANYLDDTTLVIDPASVDRALLAGTTKVDGQSGATKYVLRVSAKPTGRETGDYPSGREQDRMGTDTFHRAGWRRPGGYGGLTHGAKVRRDPHL